MERAHKSDRRDPLHRGESKTKSNLVNAGIGAFLLASLATNILNGLAFKKELDAKNELEDVYPALGTYLHNQGYPEVTELNINYEENTFSFNTILDEDTTSVCVGGYEYQMHESLKVGEIACAGIGQPASIPPGTRNA